jgi:uncharacterized protein (TIRG00374 family)
MRKDSKKLWFGVSTVVFLVIIYLADLGEFISAVQRADVTYLIPAYVIGMSPFLILAYVWHDFLKKINPGIRYLKTLQLFMAGSFLNSITPLGQFGGEPFMAYVIDRNTDASYEEAFSAVLSADLVNSIPGFTFLFGGGLYLLFFGAITDRILQVVAIGVVSCIILGVMLYLLWFRSGTIESQIISVLKALENFFGRGGKLVKAAEERLEEVESAFRTIGEDPKSLFKITLFTHTGFVVNTTVLYCLILALGVQNPAFTSIYFVLILSELANYSPTPGGSGTFEGAMAGLITLFMSVDFATALGIAMLYRTTNFWPSILIGYISLNSLERTGGVRK